MNVDCEEFCDLNLILILVKTVQAFLDCKFFNFIFGFPSIFKVNSKENPKTLCPNERFNTKNMVFSAQKYSYLLKFNIQ